METNLIPTKTICSHYDIEISFVDALNNYGLIQIEIYQEEPCIHRDDIADMERMIRLYRDLNINLEGIDVIFNLLDNERKLLKELNALRNRLSIYESEH
jgi:hypothetical protein